ncbi:39S ribosomal protein L51, mitochondrial-like [Bubalus kerabau]|uniref:39S ribosomal protein L51, mitochondrial-like n=1 Tax=Bubalus carabanensis TaxID=3119969 RepID=UPI00244ED399|nr:39S ribosomal protein L51, mitochondrial-like [Bubalus carabanensis]
MRKAQLMYTGAESNLKDRVLGEVEKNSSIALPASLRIQLGIPRSSSCQQLPSPFYAQTSEIASSFNLNLNFCNNLTIGQTSLGSQMYPCDPSGKGVPRLFHVRVTLPPPKVIDRWNEKRAMFGVYDNIGILGNFEKHPKELIKGPTWLRGWKGNELQRCIRKKRMVGNRMFIDDLHNLNKRISFLYKGFNRHGKHR